MFEKFLIKKFVKNSENFNDIKVRESYGVFTSIVGVLCNIVLFGLKLGIGFILNSVAITADSFNNLSDAGSSIVSFVGFKMASKPPDDDHPFGHGRLEYIAALIIAFIILLLGFEFFKTSLDKILKPVSINFNIYSIFILIFTVLVKVWLSLFNKKIGEKIDSKVLLATSKDSLNDVIITSTTVLSLLFTKFTGVLIDGYVGVFVSFILLYSGFSIAKDALSVILGESSPKELEEKIKMEFSKYDGIVGCHDLIIHNYGATKSMATIHAEVPDNVDIKISHDIIDKAEKQIAEDLGIFIVIHMDPVAVNDARLTTLKEVLSNVIKNTNENCFFHELKLLEKENESNIDIIFELEVPHCLEEQETTKLLQTIENEVKKINTNYNVIIKVENGYISKNK